MTGAGSRGWRPDRPSRGRLLRSPAVSEDCLVSGGRVGGRLGVDRPGTEPTDGATPQSQTDPSPAKPWGHPPQPCQPFAPSQIPGASPGPPPTKLTLLGWAPPPCPAYPLPCPLGPPAFPAAGVTRRCRGSRGSPTDDSTEAGGRLAGIAVRWIRAEAGRSEGAPPTWSPYQVGFTPRPNPTLLPSLRPHPRSCWRCQWLQRGGEGVGGLLCHQIQEHSARTHRDMGIRLRERNQR